MGEERREWGRGPAPDLNILSAVDKLRDAVLKGRVRTLLVVTVNPVHEHETALVGDLSDTYSTVILGGLLRAEHELLRHGEALSNNLPPPARS